MKDKSNNIAIIKILNFLGCSKKTIKIDLDNIHFYFKKDESYDPDTNRTSSSTKLFIINDYKNLKDIDLDTSNIRKEPANIYYSYDYVNLGKYNEKQLTDELNNFIGSSDNYENPLFFKIKEYMNKNKEKKRFQRNKQNEYLSDYMKFSEHFFTFHLSSNYIKSRSYFFVAVLIINCSIAPIGINLLIFREKIHLKIIGFVLIVIPNIILIIMNICLKNKNNIYRIDCIYSKNFDRIFIGLVKNNKKSYVNTFIFETNNIERFILEKEGIEDYNLKVIFKGNESQEICNLKNETQENLEGLAYLLNERTINNTKEINTIGNDV